MTYWTPEPLFGGQTTFVVGGGPSLERFDFGRLHGRAVIALKSAGYDCPWAHVLYSAEGPHFFGNRAHHDLIAGFPGLVVTTAMAVIDRWPQVRLARISRRFESGAVRMGKSSGHGGIGLAVAMGARRIVLLGYDMRNVDRKSHYHHRGRPQSEETYTKYRDGFAGWRADAATLGVEIVNATPETALKEFPAVDIDDELEAA